MNFPKKNLLILISIAMFGLMSCGKKCTAPAISQNIIGSWTTESAGDPVEFNSDGTYKDDNGALFSGGVSDIKTYTVGTTSVTMTVTDTSSSFNSSSSVEFNVTKNECDKIELSITGLGSETLTRN